MKLDDLITDLRKLVLHAFLEGRDFSPDEIPMTSWERSEARKTLGALLVEHGILSEEKLKKELGE